jgi:hypothetical protein
VNSSAVSVIVNPTISASAAAGGSISPSGSVNVNYGGNQVFTVTANSGYHIADVSVDGNSVGPVDSYTFTDVSASHTISATFTLIPMPTPSTTAPPTSSPAPTHVPKTAPTPTPAPSATTVTATPSSGPTVTPTTTWTVIAVSAVAIGLVFAYTVVLSRRRSEKK